MLGAYLPITDIRITKGIAFMPQIAKTQKKLRETRFFFNCLLNKNRSTNLEIEEFDFYLSAFLSAGRSVTFVLQAEEKELYDSWFPRWKASQTHEDQKLLNFINEQRVEALHRLGAEAKTDIEYIPLSKVNNSQRKHPAYGFHWWGPPGTPEPRIGQQVYYFERDGTKKEVISVCKHYIELIEKLVKDFLQDSL